MDFNGKSLLIAGGTGSFGNAVLRRFLNTYIEEIRIFSRDEKKQDDMRQLYRRAKIKLNANHPSYFETLLATMNFINYATKY